ncbi:hypothetical protein C4578_00145 [Candidatus Microgenomates bacterium]|jgi:cbb3-type cytochrome oxidase subunit 3|nr:MAG: hypothetical protein C4578_00145 [Candidatus Microgenomates bacterium]
MERKFVLQVAKVVGNPSDGFWSQVHTFFPEDQEKKEKRGDLLAVLVLAGVPEGIEAVAAGREVLARLHEEYYGNLEGTAFERLTSAVSKITSENQDIEIIAAVLFEKVLYLAIYGEGKVCLKRGDRFSQILKGDGDLQTASGVLEENDLVVIGSKKFFNVVGDGVLKASLEGGSAEEAVEALAPVILGHNDMAAAAAILALAQKNEPLEIQQVFSGETEKTEETIISPSSAAGMPEEEKVSLRKKIKDFLLERKISRRRSAFGSKKTEDLSERPIFVKKTALEKKKKVYFLAALFLLFLLGISIVFGSKKRIESQKKAQASQILSQAEEKLNQGKILSSQDSNESRVLGIQAQNLVSEAMSVSKDNEEAVFLKEQVEKFLESLGDEHYLNEPSVFMDLNLIKDGASGVAFALLNENLVILDQGQSQIYFLDAEKKSHRVLDFDEKANLITASGGKAFVFGDKGVFEIEEESAKLVIESDSGWGEIAAISSFNGNVYLLDKNTTIWRYLYSEGEFGAKKSWFIGNPPDLSKTVSMAIDSSIWVLEEKSIAKFNLGKEEAFSLQKMPEEFKAAAKIFTSEETENLYVLDKEAGKLFVIDKKGNFKSLYVSEKFKEASDIVAIEPEKRLFILAGSKIYEAALK